MSVEWPDERLIRILLERRALARVKRRQLEAAERQVADLEELIELRKAPVPRGAPEISDYYQD